MESARRFRTGREAGWSAAPFDTTSTQVPAASSQSSRSSDLDRLHPAWPPILSGDESDKIKWWKLEEPLAPEPQY